MKPQGYSDEQMGIYRLIKSLFDKGLSYRKITKHLNERGIKVKNCMKDKNIINYYLILIMYYLKLVYIVTIKNIKNLSFRFH